MLYKDISFVLLLTCFVMCIVAPVLGGNNSSTFLGLPSTFSKPMRAMFYHVMLSAVNVSGTI